MNKTIGLQLLVYSLLLAGLSYLTYHLAPRLARPTLITGLVGGGLCLLWAFRALAGATGKALPMLTLVPVSFVMLSQTVVAWGGSIQQAPQRTAAILITILFVFSIAMLMRLAYAGVFDKPESSPAANMIEDRRKPTTRKNGNHP